MISEDKLSQNLKRILFQKDMRISDLARATGIPIPTAHKIVAGTCSRPQTKSLIPIAEYFGLTIEQLKGLKPIEWLNNSEDLKELGVNQVPLLDWSDLKEKIVGNVAQFNKKIYTESAVSDLAFALVLKDASMEPMFPIDSLVIFDPQRIYRDRHYVLVKLQQYDEPLFRQLIIDAEDLFIKSLQPDLEHSRIHTLGKNDTILAVLVEARQHFAL